MTQPASPSLPPSDAARPVRAGEELELARLAPYLLRELSGSRPPLRVEQFPGGFSNLTYLLRLGPGEDARELVLRRPPFGNRVRTAHDMGREFRILSRLNPVYPSAPKPLLFCEDQEILGASFYVMERLRGVIPHRRVMDRLRPDEATARRLSEAFVDHLASLHTLDYARAGLGDLGHPQGYGRRQVEGWSERYRRAATDEHPALEAAIGWLGERIPEPVAPPGLVHNDYKYDNLVLDPADLSRIVGVLDWEMATVGDPLYDLGTTLAYWLEPGEGGALAASGLIAPAFPGSLRRHELVERYAERTGTQVSGVLFHYAFGLVKIAAIVQQIYARFRKGHTQDPRFAELDRVVGLLGDRALAAIDRGDLDPDD